MPSASGGHKNKSGLTTVATHIHADPLDLGSQHVLGNGARFYHKTSDNDDESSSSHSSSTDVTHTPSTTIITSANSLGSGGGGRSPQQNVRFSKLRGTTPPRNGEEAYNDDGHRRRNGSEGAVVFNNNNVGSNYYNNNVGSNYYNNNGGGGMAQRRRDQPLMASASVSACSSSGSSLTTSATIIIGGNGGGGGGVGGGVYNTSAGANPLHYNGSSSAAPTTTHSGGMRPTALLAELNSSKSSKRPSSQQPSPSRLMGGSSSGAPRQQQQQQQQQKPKRLINPGLDGKPMGGYTYWANNKYHYDETKQAEAVFKAQYYAKQRAEEAKLGIYNRGPPPADDDSWAFAMKPLVMIPPIGYGGEGDGDGDGDGGAVVGAAVGATRGGGGAAVGGKNSRGKSLLGALFGGAILGGGGAAAAAAATSSSKHHSNGIVGSAAPATATANIGGRTRRDGGDQWMNNYAGGIYDQQQQPLVYAGSAGAVGAKSRAAAPVPVPVPIIVPKSAKAAAEQQQPFSSTGASSVEKKKPTDDDGGGGGIVPIIVPLTANEQRSVPLPTRGNLCDAETQTEGDPTPERDWLVSKSTGTDPIPASTTSLGGGARTRAASRSAAPSTASSKYSFVSEATFKDCERNTWHNVNPFTKKTTAIYVDDHQYNVSEATGEVKESKASFFARLMCKGNKNVAIKEDHYCPSAAGTRAMVAHNNTNNNPSSPSYAAGQRRVTLTLDDDDLHRANRNGDIDRDYDDPLGGGGSGGNRGRSWANTPSKANSRRSSSVSASREPYALFVEDDGDLMPPHVVSVRGGAGSNNNRGGGNARYFPNISPSENADRPIPLGGNSPTELSRGAGAAEPSASLRRREPSATSYSRSRRERSYTASSAANAVPPTKEELTEERVIEAEEAIARHLQRTRVKQHKDRL